MKNDDAPAVAEPDEEGGVWFVLEKASLEVAKVGKNYQLLNCDDHANFLRKHKRDPALLRPDIIHQALLAILDSPLNKAGKLKGLYVMTDTKLSIRATNGPEKLLRVVKQPVTKHLPVGAHRIGLSHSAPKVIKLHDYVAAMGLKSKMVFVVGAMAHGKIEADYIEDLIAVSEYPLSAACCIGRICNAIEQQFKIL
ncbi:hypothetical protein L7F22_041795 [Adiantum nelumboides]|nr:hypothetical protein [Adiantum nelumboides]